MGLLNSLVGRCFSDEGLGRVVVFPGDRRRRAYLVVSRAEELKIASFLEMFYFAHLAILILGYLLAYAWARWLVFALGSPAAHVFRTACIFLGVYSLVVGLPYLWFWKAYKRALLGFVSEQDAVLATTKRPAQHRIVLTLVALILVVAGLALVWLTGSKQH
jgi:hypothetical protein